MLGRLAPLRIPRQMHVSLDSGSRGQRPPHQTALPPINRSSIGVFCDKAGTVQNFQSPRQGIKIFQ